MIASLLLALTVACTEGTVEDRAHPPESSSGPSDVASPVAGGRIVVGIVGEPPTLDPSSPLANESTLMLAPLIHPKPFRSNRKGDAERGPFRLKDRTAGLELVFVRNEEAAKPPLLDRVIVRFVSSTGLLIELLSREHLDVGIVPSSINTEERMEAAGLRWNATAGSETIWLDGRGSGLSPDGLRGLWNAIDRRAMEEGLVRDEGIVAQTFTAHRTAARKRKAVPPDEIQLVYASGDEMLDLVARALFEQLTEASIDVELVSIEPHALARIKVPGIRISRSVITDLDRLDAAARRGTVWPLFQVNGFVAWSGSFRGGIAEPTSAGPFGAVEEWWTRR